VQESVDILQKKVQSRRREQGERNLSVFVIFSTFFCQEVVLLIFLPPERNRRHIQCIFSVQYRS